jgi:hypothetical protein
MPHKTAPKIELSARVRQIIEEIARQRSTEYRLVVRASLILAMADGAGITNWPARKIWIAGQSAIGAGVGSSWPRN